jgi:ABC-type oligopeptide transport system substrate-binding subunit
VRARRRTRSPGRYGRGRRRYFVTPVPQLDFFALNSRRPLFADARMRRAVNYALDRRRLAAGHAGATVVLSTCDATPCAEQAQT